MAHIPVGERRRSIVEAAVKVITGEGPARATTRRVAAAAKAPLASLHYTFRNKEELFRAVIERCLDLVDEKYQEQLPEVRGLREGVRALLKINRDWCLAEPGFHVAEYELFLWALRTPSAHEFTRYIYQRWFERVGVLLAKCMDASERTSCNLERLARDVVAVLDGMVLQIIALGHAGPGPEDINRLADAAMISVGRPS